MNDTLGFILLALAFVGLIFGSALLGTAIGAFAGWVVGLTPLGGAVMKVWFSLTHVECQLWELGAFLGFICGFLRGVITVKYKEEE